MDFSVSIEFDETHVVNSGLLANVEQLRNKGDVNFVIPAKVNVILNGNEFQYNFFCNVRLAKYEVFYNSDMKPFKQESEMFKLVVNETPCTIGDILACDNGKINVQCSRTISNLESSISSLHQRAENARNRFKRSDEYDQSMAHIMEFVKYINTHGFEPVDLYCRVGQSLIEEYIKPLVDEFTWMMITGE